MCCLFLHAVISIVQSRTEVTSASFPRASIVKPRSDLSPPSAPINLQNKALYMLPDKRITLLSSNYVAKCAVHLRDHAHTRMKYQALF